MTNEKRCREMKNLKKRLTEKDISLFLKEYNSTHDKKIFASYIQKKTYKPNKNKEKINNLVDVLNIVVYSFAYYLLIGVYLFRPQSIAEHKLFIISVSVFFFAWLVSYIGFSFERRINYKINNEA